MYWDEKPYYSLNYYLKQKYGEKVFKISLNAGLTCPNRDGTIDDKGCIFCSEGGSGDFTFKGLTITEQIEKGKDLLKNKFNGRKFIAYFQAFTNTYGDIDYLKKIYTEAANHPDIVGISIATRPDCINKEVCELIASLKQKTDVWVELGLQTIHEKTAEIIRRGYSLNCFDEAVLLLNKFGIDIIVHLILGLPDETKEQMLESVEYVCSKPINGIKLHLLHVLKNTDLETMYNKGLIKSFDKEEYINLIVDCIERIPKDIVIHRLTGDAPWKLLVLPKWSTDKKNILNLIHKEFMERNSYQGIRLDNKK